jgi:hypothetical protein
MRGSQDQLQSLSAVRNKWPSHYLLMSGNNFDSRKRRKMVEAIREIGTAMPCCILVSKESVNRGRIVDNTSLTF